MSQTTSENSFSLRDLPLGARLILTVFLCAAGLSYLAGLNQLHFQHAPAGEPLPNAEDTKKVYHGTEGISTLERLITADETKPFNATGTMKPAFTTESLGWDRKLREQAKRDERTILERLITEDENKSWNGEGSMRAAFTTKSLGWGRKLREFGKAQNLEPKEAEQGLRADREWEVNAMTEWIRAGAKKDDYTKFVLPDKMQPKDKAPEAAMMKLQERQEFEVFKKEGDKWTADVSVVVENRCARCHAPGKPAPAGEIHLDTYEGLKDYLKPEKAKRSRANDPNHDLQEAEKVLRAQREREVQAVVAWIHDKAKKDEYSNFLLPDTMQPKNKDEEAAWNKLQETQDHELFRKDGDKWHANVSKIIEVRCVRCHSEGKPAPAGDIHLDTYEGVQEYLKPEKQGGGISLRKLAQSTHVHLPGFAMLFGLTGLIFGLTRYPGIIRAVLCPLPLTAMLCDVSSWWLMRANEDFAWVTIAMGGIAATGLALQVVLGVFDMYGGIGKAVWIIVLLLGLAGMGGLMLKVVDPYLKYEKENPAVRD